MITDAAMHRKALRVLAGLGDSEPERERARVIVDHALVWDWAHADAPAAELPPPAPLRDPRAARFADWWDRNRCSLMWMGADWIRAFVWWSAPLGIPGAEWLALSDDVEDELREREGREPRAA